MATEAPLVLTPGEPAGIGPDLVVRLASGATPTRRPLVVIADPALLEERARQLNTPLQLRRVSLDGGALAAPEKGVLQLLPVPLRAPCRAGAATPENAPYVLESLQTGIDACLEGRAAALVTGPVHKGVMRRAGVPFSGHTELLAQRTGARQAVMLLVAGPLRVALATTHLPLAQVAESLNRQRLGAVLRTLHQGLQRYFAIPDGRILVCGLNPHAGEEGSLGREELEIITPCLEELRAAGLRLEGPLAADTAFLPQTLERADAVLAMYHDQGLPVLKHSGFGQAVNITLGLPIVRTSVDHGTALELAGTGRGDPASLQAAVSCAAEVLARLEGSAAASP